MGNTRKSVAATK